MDNYNNLSIYTHNDLINFYCLKNWKIRHKLYLDFMVWLYQNYLELDESGEYDIQIWLQKIMRQFNVKPNNQYYVKQNILRLTSLYYSHRYWYNNIKIIDKIDIDNWVVYVKFHNNFYDYIDTPIVKIIRWKQFKKIKKENF